MPNSVIDYILDSRWAITPSALSAIIDIVQRNASVSIDPKIFHKADYEIDPNDSKVLQLSRKEAILGNIGEILEGTDDVLVREKVAIVSILGPIFPRANILTMVSGAVDLEHTAIGFNVALNDPNIYSIILDMDSPGGLVTEIDAFAEMVFNAQAIKPVIAFVNGMAASAAYWIASAASEIVAAKTGEVGSIGVIAAIRDTSVKDEKAGVQNINIISNISPLKRVDYKTEEGRKGVQKIVNDLGVIFAETVARNRGTDFDDVVNNFGKGDVLLSKDALDVLMIDEISSLESLINRQNEKAHSTIGGLFMPKLIKDGTSEDVKTENPGVYQAIKEDGKREALIDIETAKAEARKEGITAENERIKGIESLDDGENKEIVSENKFNTEMNKGDVAVLIQEKNKEKAAKAKKDLEADQEALDNPSSQIDTSQDGDDDQNQREASAKVMAAGMNEKRGLRK